MKIGIMQPYFLPYLGYWQLMDAVDCYVILDDVAFIKGGWIHRNRIQNHGHEQRIILPVSGASQNRMICELQLARGVRAWKKLHRSVQLAYCHAPQYADTAPLFERVLDFPDNNLSGFLTNSIREVAHYLSINTTILRASEVEYDRSLHGVNRILELCSQLGADYYYNAIGGKLLYDPQCFAQRDISLRFVRMKQTLSYPQGKHAFCPGLSILDAMMYNGQQELRSLLQEFELES